MFAQRRHIFRNPWVFPGDGIEYPATTSTAHNMHSMGSCITVQCWQHCLVVTIPDILRRRDLKLNQCCEQCYGWVIKNGWKQVWCCSWLYMDKNLLVDLFSTSSLENLCMKNLKMLFTEVKQTSVLYPQQLLLWETSVFFQWRSTQKGWLRPW